MTKNSSKFEHQRDHPGKGEHDHSHGSVDPSLVATERGIWAVKWSFIGLFITALVADGYHARTDGWTSLAVLVGAIGVWLGYPLADPVAGLLITAAILGIVWQSGKAVFTRLLDGVEPEIIDEVREVACRVPGVENVAEVRARWVGHRLYVEANIAVARELTVTEGHEIATEVNHQLLHHLSYLGAAVIHVDPLQEAGEEHHRISAHSHDDLPIHSH